MKQKNGRRGTIQCREDLIPDCDKHAVPRSATMPWCQTGVGSERRANPDSIWLGISVY